MNTSLGLPGLRPGDAQSHLAAIGLLRVLHRQRPDWGATMRFGPMGAEIDIPVTVEGLGVFLLDCYVPLPAICAWNAGSGLGLGYTPAGIQKPGSRRCPEIDTLAEGNRHWAATLTIARDVVAQAIREQWTKSRVVQECRNRYPDYALPWVDACWAIDPDRLIANPSLGTGGNIGSADLGSLVARYTHAIRTDPRAERWLIHALLGVQSVPLPSGTGAHLSATAEGQNLVNPWLWLFAIEGLVAVAGGPMYRARPGGRRWPCVTDARDAHVLGGYDRQEVTHALWLPQWSKHVTWQLLEDAVIGADYLRADAIDKHGQKSAWRMAQTILDAAVATATAGMPSLCDAVTGYPCAVRNGQAQVYMPGYTLYAPSPSTTPNLVTAESDTVWGTLRVAEFLGVAPRSVRTIANRMGVKPVGRGPDGRNLYPTETLLTASRLGQGKRTDLGK